MAGGKGSWMNRVRVLEPLPVFALVTDRQGKIRWLNSFNADQNGVKRRALIGKLAAEVWPESKDDAELDAKVRKTGRPISHVAFGRTRTGRPVHLRVTRAPLGRNKVLVVGVEASAEMRECAIKSLLEMAVSRDDRPLNLDGNEAAFRRMVTEGKAPVEIAAALDLTADEIIASLWRLSR
jgi:PAS domain-containing protein